MINFLNSDPNKCYACSNTIKVSHGWSVERNGVHACYCEDCALKDENQIGADGLWFFGAIEPIAVPMQLNRYLKGPREPITQRQA